MGLKGQSPNFPRKGDSAAVSKATSQKNFKFFKDNSVTLKMNLCTVMNKPNIHTRGFLTQGGGIKHIHIREERPIRDISGNPKNIASTSLQPKNVSSFYT